MHDQIEGRFWNDVDGFVVCVTEVDIPDGEAVVVSMQSSDEIAAHLNVDLTALIFRTLSTGVVDGCVTRVLPEPTTRFALDNECDAAATWSPEDDLQLIRLKIGLFWV